MCMEEPDSVNTVVIWQCALLCVKTWRFVFERLTGVAFCVDLPLSIKIFVVSITVVNRVYAIDQSNLCTMVKKSVCFPRHG